MHKYLVFGMGSQRGGIESFLINYISKMVSEEDQFDFVLFDFVPDFISNSALNKCTMHIVPKRTKNPILYYKKLNEILSKEKYDVVWYNVCTLSDILLLKLAKRWNVPCRIVHSHNGANMGGTLIGLAHSFNKKIIKKYVTDYWACSEVAAKFMFPPEIINNQKVKYIKNAIDTNAYRFNEETREKVRKELQLTNELLIGHIGRFHFQKNHEFILDIFEKIKESDDNVRLLLIGDGELKGKISSIAKERGVLQSICMMEKRTDINELMQAMDVFLFPSLFEGLPFVLVEAQTAGLPCVISDTISKEVILTDNVQVLSLHDSIDKWISAILKSGEEKSREKYVEMVSSKGFDISERAVDLKNYLNKIIAENENIC